MYQLLWAYSFDFRLFFSLDIIDLSFSNNWLKYLDELFFKFWMLCLRLWWIWVSRVECYHNMFLNKFWAETVAIIFLFISFLLIFRLWDIYWYFDWKILFFRFIRSRFTVLCFILRSFLWWNFVNYWQIFDSWNSWKYLTNKKILPNYGSLNEVIRRLQFLIFWSYLLNADHSSVTNEPISLFEILYVLDVVLKKLFSCWV